MLADIDERRLRFASNVLPDAKVFVGDISKSVDELVDVINPLVKGEMFGLSMTPPCQGMSQNGIKTIMKAIKEGKRPTTDARNYLFMPSLEIVKRTKPSFIFFENVREVKNTKLIIDGRVVSFVDYFEEQLKSMGYEGCMKELDFSNFGLPQHRKRAVGVYSRTPLNIDSLFAPVDNRIVTVRDVIGDLPPLDAKDKQFASNTDVHVLHRVPVMRPQLYEWVSMTPEGKSALENNVCNRCSYVSSQQSVYCESCTNILPKPHVSTPKGIVVVRGYSSSYRRLRWDKPSNTVTTRSAFASSAYNLHPEQNRVLSTYECAVLQGVQPEKISWFENGTNNLFPDGFIREVIGEAVPPLISRLFGQRILKQLRLASN